MNIKNKKEVSGDLDTFNYLIQRNKNLKIGTSIDSAYLYEKIPHFYLFFLKIQEGFLSKKLLESNTHGMSLLLKLLVQRQFKKFKFASRGFIETTTLINSVVETMDYYFETSKNIGPQKAFLKFKSLVLQKYKFRSHVVKYHLTENFDKNPNLAKLIHYIENLPNRKMVMQFGTGMFVLQNAIYCGRKYSSKDREERNTIVAQLNSSKSMKSFLEKVAKS